MIYNKEKIKLLMIGVLVTKYRILINNIFNMDSKLYFNEDETFKIVLSNTFVITTEVLFGEYDIAYFQLTSNLKTDKEFFSIVQMSGKSEQTVEEIAFKLSQVFRDFNHTLIKHNRI